MYLLLMLFYFMYLPYKHIPFAKKCMWNTKLLFFWHAKKIRYVLLYCIFVQSHYFVGPPHCIRRIRPTKKCEARKSVHEIVVNHHFWKWPHHNAYEFYHKIEWGGLTKKCDEKCAHCARPSTLRSSNSTHEIVAARKIGQQNSGQSSSLKWPYRNAYVFYYNPQNSG